MEWNIRLVFKTLSKLSKLKCCFRDDIHVDTIRQKGTELEDADFYDIEGKLRNFNLHPLTKRLLLYIRKWHQTAVAVFKNGIQVAWKAKVLTEITVVHSDIDENQFLEENQRCFKTHGGVVEQHAGCFQTKAKLQWRAEVWWCPGRLLDCMSPYQILVLSSGIWWSLSLDIRYLWRHKVTSYWRWQTNVLAKFVDTTCILFYSRPSYSLLYNVSL